MASTGSAAAQPGNTATLPNVIALATIPARPSQPITARAVSGMRPTAVARHASRAPAPSSHARVCRPKYDHDGLSAVSSALSAN